MKLKDLKPNPANPRKISKEKLKMLSDSIREYGSLDGIVFNRRTKTLIGAHQRQKIHPDAEITVTESFDPPLLDGTVARGEAMILGHVFPYREVDWEPAKEMGANIAANKGAGEWDFPQLSNWLTELDQLNFNLDLTMFDEKERDKIVSHTGSDEELYTKKIEIPIYEPRGENPAPTELYDVLKTKELYEEIQSSKIPEEIRMFLLVAAQRHTVFNYEKIAEFYAHASKPVQELMEKSALVIIDFDKAIENGFVAMSKEISETYGDEK